MDSLGKTQRLKKQLQDAHDVRDSLERRLKAQEERQFQSGVLLEQAKAQRAAMGDDGLSAKREQLKQAESRRAQAEQQLDQGTQQLEKRRKGLPIRNRSCGICAGNRRMPVVSCADWYGS